MLAICRLLFLGMLAGLIPAVALGNPALEGYSNYEAFTLQVRELDKSDLIAVQSLGKSYGGREIWLLTLGAGKVDEKPALVILGGVQGAHLAGCELATRMVKRLAEKSATDENIRRLLETTTLYFIPWPDPDASEKCFAKPYRQPLGNARSTDDDRDFQMGEDPPDDLNGDGFITWMRVEDESGDWFPHPDDPRILIEADSKKNERGKFRVYLEGRDDDHDGQFNEDAGDGVAFNHNFTFGYQPFERSTGANAVSEPECRAVADFLFQRANIGAVFSFSPEDNLFHPWKPDGQAEGNKIKTRVLGADAPVLEYMAEEYRKIQGGGDCPAPPAPSGSFSQWSYFHYGRWPLAARAWWVPKIEIPVDPAKKPSGEKRGGDDLNTLRWLMREKIDGFVSWTPIQHPDFPGKKVEVGGFKPLLQLNPPAKELDALADKHCVFIERLGGWLPSIAVTDLKAEPLGGGVYRLSASVVNRGFLPTMPEMGQVNGEAFPLQAAWTLPANVQLLQGHARAKLKRIPGAGGRAEQTWLLRFPQEAPKSLDIKVWAPAVGANTATVELK